VDWANEASKEVPDVRWHPALGDVPSGGGNQKPEAKEGVAFIPGELRQSEAVTGSARSKPTLFSTKLLPLRSWDDRDAFPIVDSPNCRDTLPD